jgi:hypothetical protein
MAVEYVFQELDKLPPGFSVPPGRTKPWGTTQAILMAADVIHEPFAAINADDFYGAASFRVLAEHLRSGSADYAMVGFILRNTLSEFGSVARGACRVGADGYLQGIAELTKIEKDGNDAKYTDAAGILHRLGGNETVSMNMWGFTPALFAQLREEFIAFLQKSGKDEKTECYIPLIVNNLTSTGRARCKVLRTTDAWFGVTYREDRPRVIESVRTLITRGEYPEKLWA